MRKNLVKEKAFEFALEIVKMNQYLVEQRREFILSKQLLRSGTAVGALIHESEYAESRADFIHKLAIALKEGNESEYWIELLFQAEKISREHFDDLRPKIKEINRLLISIIKTAKQKLK